MDFQGKTMTRREAENKLELRRKCEVMTVEMLLHLKHHGGDKNPFKRSSKVSRILLSSPGFHLLCCQWQHILTVHVSVSAQEKHSFYNLI